MKLKITTIGNSAGVILPKELLARLRLEKGDELHALETPDGVRYVSMAKGLVKPSGSYSRTPRRFSDSERRMLGALAQQAALAALEPSAPVQAAQEAQAWLVHTVDVNTSAELVRLDFKSEAAGPVRGRLVFAAQPLRQWLGILHDQCRRAGWPESAWPEWMQQAQAQPPAGQGARLH